MRSGNWWQWAVACGLAAATAAVLVSAGVHVASAGSLSPTEIRDWAVAVFALGASVLAAFRWASKKTHDPPERLPWERISTAKRLLAEAVDEYWKKESRYRNWEKPPLIQVRWRAPVDPRVPSHSSAVKNAPRTASSTEVAELAENFRACEPRRLVILGGPGMGKTTLAVQLLVELLATREGRENEPVPVLLAVAQWDTERYPELQEWLAKQLYQEQPGLRWLGVKGIRQMADQGHVLPILDGLDELPKPAQANVIAHLNRSLGAGDQLILTSRTAEYIRAVRKSASGRGLGAAAVLEPLPVTREEAAAYLKDSLQSQQEEQETWKRTLKILRTARGTALTRVTATPLGLWLLREVYIEGNRSPDELTDSARFSTSKKLLAHLFAHLIKALVPRDRDEAWSRGLSRTYEPDDVQRWLAFLAYTLMNQTSQSGTGSSQQGTRDFEWWRLASITGKPPSPYAVRLILVLAPSVVTGLLDGPVFGLVGGLCVWFAAKIMPLDLAEDIPGYADFRVSRWSKFLRQALESGLWTLMGGFGVALIGAFGGSLVAGLVAGLGTAFGLGLAFGFIRWIEMPSPETQATGPRASLRADRMLNLARIACGGLIVGLVLGLAVGLLRGLEDGLKGALVAVVCGLVPGLLGSHRAWLAYVWATWRLSREGALPRKLMPFLDNMHRLGLLRAVGRVYQFRHAELQDHLAAAYQRAD